MRRAQCAQIYIDHEITESKPDAVKTSVGRLLSPSEKNGSRRYAATRQNDDRCSRLRRINQHSC